MPIKKENRAAFETLRKEYHIEFNDDIAADKWPANHRTVFESIEKVKQYKYSTYAVAQGNEDGPDAAPWKAEAKIQAKKLTKAAKDCISRNEATWRFACEPIVFSRLSAEVACKNCRKRVWRSEIEAAIVDESSRAAASLRQRQLNRERCRCARETRPGDEDERVGLNKLFIYRTDDTVIHPEDLKVKLPQAQKPDRTYGLRQTRNFENLLLHRMGSRCYLEDHLGRVCSVEDHLQNQPHYNDETGESLLFPFLVVEAKAGNASDDWASILLQTAFPIYTYLNAQQSLRLATVQKSKWTSGPLVWFFMSRGEDWRLCLAFQTPTLGGQQSSDGTHHITNIVQVWAGIVTKLDDALQLFLIVDFMSDWARDTYRPALLTELRIFCSLDAADRATVFTDTDIFSSKGILPSHAFGDIKMESQPDAQEIQEAFRRLDSSHGIVRHIRPIKSRFASLLITADNFKTFSSKIPQIKRVQFIRRILSQFHSAGQTPSFLTIGQLSAMEDLWTGHLRPNHSFRLKETKFFTLHIITYSLSASWEQVRELCFIAIAEDVFEAVIAESKLKVGKGKAKVPKITMAQDFINFFTTKLETCLNTINNTPAQQNLLASICRASHYIDTTVDQSQSTQWFKSSPPDILELVNSLRKYHKKGDIEPHLSFLYTSESYKTQMVEQDDADGANSDDLSSIASSDENDGACFNHHRACPLLMGNLRVSREGAVLIYGGGGSYQPVEERSPSALCVYIIHGPTEPPDNATLARIIKNNFEEHDVYHTTRKHRKIWNLRKPYGVFYPYGGPCFTEWLTAMNKPLPTRQGSPRSALDSGRMIFSRNYFRGQDPRLVLLNYGQSSYTTIKKQFALFLLLQDVVAWAAIAYKKKSRGTPCCKLCAEKFDGTHYEDLERDGYIPGLCDDCYIELDIHSGCGLPPSVKIVLRKFLERIGEHISAIDAGVDTRTSLVTDFWKQVRSSI